jgi:uncharacterized protein with PIN domain
MIVMDSSALIASLFDETGGPACTAASEAASVRLISAVRSNLQPNHRRGRKDWAVSKNRG